MKHILVMPMYDPDGAMLRLVQAILPDLTGLFAATYLGITEDQPADTSLASDDFLRLVRLPAGLPVGEQFRRLFTTAARQVPPEACLHLAYPDRVSFSLLTAYKAVFLADLNRVTPVDLPLIFHRSPSAWQTHPDNYREIESMATAAGRWLLGQSLDFAWCHLVIQASDLIELLPRVKAPEIHMVAEIILQSKRPWRTRDVDWLAWEDPFILGRDPAELKSERERSPAETLKRLGYVLPILQLISQRAALPKK